MVDFHSLLAERDKYPLYSLDKDTWVSALLENKIKDKNPAIIVPFGFLSGQSSKLIKQRKQLLETFNVAAIYDIGSPYLSTPISFAALVLSKDKVDSVRIANFKGKSYLKHRKIDWHSPYLGLAPELFSTVYSTYLTLLSNWKKSNEIPDFESNNWEFNTIPAEKLSKNNLYPEFYTKSMQDVRDFLVRKDLALLKEVADIILPRPDPDGKTGPVFRFAKAAYPFDWENTEEGRITNVKLQKGDIVLSRVGESKLYLFYEDKPNEIFASQNMFVIRPKTVSSEFLFLYLNGETGQNIQCAVKNIRRTGTVFASITKKDLGEFPVIIPERDNYFYYRIFAEQYLKLKFDEETELIKIENTCLEICEDKPRLLNAEDILCRELLEHGKYYKTDEVQGIIDNDLAELNACFRAKAYKATLILAGSILEAFLIDWLSELYQENFFNRPISPDTKWISIRQKLEERDNYEPDLIDYIREIKKIRKPEWMEDDKAHKIRKNRNLVHAKLCLKDCEKINEELCHKVINYLRDIINSRFE